MASPIPIIAIIGPTGIGKTRLSVNIASAVDGEVISVDSIQVYRDCPIMAAQVTQEEMKGVPHHLVDYLDVAEEPVDFTPDAIQCIKSIHSRGRIPIICGGSTSLVEPLLFHPFVQEQNLLVLVLNSDIKTIANLCDQRIETMMKDGLLDEVKHLCNLEKQHGRFEDATRSGAWKSIGYPELRKWCSAEDAPTAERLLREGKLLMQQNTVGYASMQLDFLWSRFIPALSSNQKQCTVFDVTSRETFAQEVEIPAIRRCKDWILDSAQEFSLVRTRGVGFGADLVPRKEMAEVTSSLLGNFNTM
ncbi:hypothetical protein CORC01_08265 [Colletotrichum orchidophilum]|uniref:tRNA dimethylallyltransferase n=1 Tax=Colletotrichum orchidophilum TaxID=1209926 RepID=A0A1G4B5E7_9PEZI|nr:uncharacterized protein CORC01_08265 [Colletotrichum orchidophilum]OHE96502.1 hypothetical protein CORC01_08265 [Colletotrichum orchidophilum]